MPYLLTLTRQLSGEPIPPRSPGEPLYIGLVTRPTGMPHGDYAGTLDGDPCVVTVGDFTDVQPGIRFPKGRADTGHTGRTAA